MTGPIEPIPQPPGRPLVGNLLDMLGGTPIQDLMVLARQQGPIFEVTLPGRAMVVVSGFELVDELCDDRRFDKLVQLRTRGNRSIAGDGLFTAWTYEPNWRKAHNILLPNFSQQAMKGYLPMMADIAEQLTQKWERLNPDDEVDVPGDMTRLTMDTIGLCGFDYRFNSFYREEPHPFVAAMTRALTESRERQTRLPGQTRLMVRARRQFQEDTTTMYSLVDRLIEERKQSPDAASKKDLLGHMLSGVDKQTGERLDDVNIRYQIITFLVAGHETTSGLLSFALYFLLKKPLVLERAYDEVDRVLGSGSSAPPTYEQVRRLDYCSQILKESLRLWPTAPAFSRYPYETTVIGGRYRLEKGVEILALTPMLHRDPKIWGPDAEQFDPTRFARESERSRPANAYKPFGDGQRACIGRQFAMQEAVLVLGMLLQRFELVDHRNYQLKIQETLTIKPEDFRIQVRPRTQRAAVAVGAADSRPESEPEAEPETEPVPAPVVVEHSTPLLVLYGSNLGSTQDLAQQMAADAASRGFSTHLAPLDDYAGKLPTQGAVLITSASYNGNPSDNGERFFDWISGSELGPDALRGVKYTVFGCGSQDWPSTYQRVPNTIDRQLEAHGAERIYARGEGDTSDDFDSQFHDWYGPLWQSLAEAVGAPADSRESTPAGHRYEVQTVTQEAVTSPFGAEYGAKPFRVLVNRELLNTSGPHAAGRSTRHIEVALPGGVAYRAGDYLGVLPRNREDLARRAMTRFGYPADARIRITSNSSGSAFLPLDQVVEVATLLTSYVDLQDTAKRSHVQALSQYTECPPEKERLVALGGDDPESAARYRDEVLAKHVSILDLLDACPSCALPFNIFLEFLPQLKPRYYSISSSPAIDPGRCSVTVGVLDAPARSGQGRYRGVCSCYLAEQAAGSHIDGFVRGPSTPFHLPLDPGVPVIMVGAGTGLAPYRGFLQERAALKAAGRQLGPSMLVFGCRNPQTDYLYEDELRSLQQDGVVEVECAFSRLNGTKTYVQDRIGQLRDQVWHLLERGAVVYVCGDASRMAPDVRRAFASIYEEKTGADGLAAEAWLADLGVKGRYMADVWPTK